MLPWRVTKLLGNGLCCAGNVAMQLGLLRLHCNASVEMAILQLTQGMKMSIV